MNHPLAPPARRVVALLAALVLMLGVLSSVRPVVETASANTTGEGQFVPLPNTKLLDTKTGYGTSDGQAQQVPANGTLTFPVLGRAGIASSGVSAVSLALTVAKPGATGKLSVYPSDTPTTISTVSFSAGETATGADFTQITGTGQVTLSNQSSSPVEVQIAVDGYFQSADAVAGNAVYKPVTTAVLWDSRLNVGTPGRILPLFAGEEVEVQVAGQTGIPADCTQAAAVALNIAAFFYSEDGDVLVHPSDASPGEPVLQYVKTDPESDAFTISKLSCTGKLKIKNRGTGAVHLSISVRGYFTAWNDDNSGARFKPIASATLVDTATGAGVTGGSTAKLGPEQSLVFKATGPAGAPVNTVAAAALTVNVREPEQGGSITLRPTDAFETWISTLHFQQGEDATGFDTATPSGLGEIVVTNHSWGSVHLNITARGYYIHSRVEVIPASEGEPDPIDKPDKADAAIEAADDTAAAGTDLGPTSYDPGTGTVITTATTTDGLAQAAQPITVPAEIPDMGVGDDSITPTPVPDDAQPDPSWTVPEDDGSEPVDDPEPAVATTTVTPRAVLAPNPAAVLNEIADQVINFGTAELPGADAIQGVSVESEKNRVLIEASSAPVAMQQALTTMFGPSKVAIRVVTSPPPQLAATFYGGALLRFPDFTLRCTGSFTWKFGRFRYIVTAGHCGGVGTHFYGTKPDGQPGQIADVTQTNWRIGQGSIKTESKLPPKYSRYSGDIGMAKIYKGNVASPWMHGDGGKNYKVVGDATNYRARKGDKVCLFGMKSGGSCGWKVIKTEKHKFDSGVIANPVVKIHKSNSQKCVWLGDSGGPVYTKVNGGVWARGVISGTSGHGRTGSCDAWFTDIAEARRLANGGYPLSTAHP